MDRNSNSTAFFQDFKPLLHAGVSQLSGLTSGAMPRGATARMPGARKRARLWVLWVAECRVKSRLADEPESPSGEFPMFASTSSGKTLAITSGATAVLVFPAGPTEPGHAGTLFDPWDDASICVILNRFKYRNE
jgi:hypothetical protein